MHKTFVKIGVLGLSGRGVTHWIDSQETGVRILYGTKKIEMSSHGICKQLPFRPIISSYVLVCARLLLQFVLSYSIVTNLALVYSS